MGRKNEFKASKSFTIGISELAWLSEYTETNKIKASEYINTLIRTAMVDDKKDKVMESNTHPAYCKTCNDWTPHTIDIICTNCNQLNEALKDRVDKKKKTLNG